ncbi:hypothetical protein [Streptomyces kanamyceticus]|uniref:Lipoprotein n=1 Tax=Streptomyces kanamyceticus TaxID=1967 RepID=A0A5J6GGE5_STRKN|nr:hypothetical protein [Streptomyces kanamyceticus]QEU95040.1 hypothetical protein CP970_32770 [Streptomyces kanamyceticus]
MRHRIQLCAPTLAAVLGTALAATGCGSSGTEGSPSTSTPPSASATPPAKLCTTIITKWAREIYDSGDDTYGDYQSMGLSNGQYLILRDVLDAARAERKRQSAAAGRKLLDREARERCAERYRDGGPSGGPWV